MNKFLISKYAGFQANLNSLRGNISGAKKGLGTLEVLLITVVLVTLVVAFRASIEGVVKEYLGKINPAWKSSVL